MAKATTPTLSSTEVSANSENTVTITLKPADTSYKHKIRYSFGKYDKIATGISIGTGFSGAGNKNVTFTPPVALCRQIPNKDSDTCIIYCYTYTSDGTLIGRTSVNLTIRVPAYVLSFGYTKTGNRLLSGEYVQGKSTLTMKITAEPNPDYGGTITGYSTTIDGKTYKGSEFTTSVLSAGEKTIKVTVTDSRGRTQTTREPFVETITVRPYFAPVITEFTLERKEDNPETVVASIEGKYAKINTVDLSYLNFINHNYLGVTVGDIKHNYCNVIEEKESSDDDNTVLFIAEAVITGVSTDTTYTAIATVADYYATPVAKESIVPTVDVTMDFHKSGKGIAVGKVAEHENLLDVDWDLKVHGKILDADDNVLFSDSGWQRVEEFADSFEEYNAETQPLRYRRVGNQVFVNGAIKPTSIIAASAIGETTAFNLPYDFAPQYTQYFLCQGSGVNKWLCVIRPEGTVNVARYGTTSSIDIPTDAWLQINVSFLVD